MKLTIRSIRSAGLVGMRALARPSAVRVLVLQAVGEELAHLAIGRVDGEQDAVEDDEADRAGVDQVDRVLRPLRRRPVLVDRRDRAGGQAAKHQQVVGRGVVEGRGQLRVEQVGDVQVEELRAGPRLQRACTSASAASNAWRVVATHR